MKKLFAVLIMMIVLTCGKDGVNNSMLEEMESVEGIYTLTSFTHNENACLKGDEILQDQEYKYIVLTAQDYAPYGIYLFANLCTTVEKCNDMHRQIKTREFGFIDGEQIATCHTGSASSGFYSKMVTTGMTGNNECRDGHVSDIHITFDGTSFTIEEQISYADTFPVDEEGFCTTDNTARNVNECSEMKIYSADFLQSVELAYD